MKLRIDGIPTRTEEQILNNKVKSLDISQIVVKSNVRVNYIELEELKNSIKKYGLLEPLIVSRNSDGLYRLVSGHRRYFACKILYEENNDKYSKIECVIKDVTSDVDVMEIQLIENIQRSDLNSFELADALDKLKHFTKKSNSELGELLCKSEKWVRDNIKAMEIVKETKSDDVVASNKKLTINHVLEMKDLKTDQKKDLIEEAAESNLTVKEIREAKNRFKNDQDVKIKDVVREVVKERKTKSNAGEINGVNLDDNKSKTKVTTCNKVKINIDGNNIGLEKRAIEDFEYILKFIDKTILYEDIKSTFRSILEKVNVYIT